MPTGRERLRGFALACHPAPTAVVTLAVTVLAVGAGRDLAGAVLVAVTVLVGQLSVGWSNDALDARRDRAVGRTAKPVVAGLVGGPTLMRAALAALAVAVVLSFVVAGPAGGACHVVFLVSAWAYNLRLKSTPFSLVPYGVGFAALPGFVTYGLDPARAPAWWAVAAAGLLGVAAGLANAAPDVADDRATRVDGAVGRLGARAARVWCAVVAFIATVLLALGSGLAAPAAVGLVVVVGAALVVGLRTRDGAALFPAVLGVAVLDVLLVAALTPVG